MLRHPLAGPPAAVLLVVAFLLLPGCGSLRFASTLRPDPAAAAVQAPGGTRFAVAGLRIRQQAEGAWFTVDKVTGDDVRTRAAALYPGLFGTDFTDLPVTLDVTCRGELHQFGAMVTGFTLGLLPFPYSYEMTCEARVRVPGAEGFLSDESRSFDLTVGFWGGITPLPLLPVPGRSDLPRAVDFFGSSNDVARQRMHRLTVEALAAAAAGAVRKVDGRAAAAEADFRRRRIRRVTVGGTAYWTWLAYVYEEGADRPTAARLYFFRQPPSWRFQLAGEGGAFFRDFFRQGRVQTVEVVEVARRGADGGWRPVTAYLRWVPELTAATVELEAGRPARAVIRRVERPPIEDFIDLPPKAGAAEIRWRNAVLVQAKNQTLPGLLASAGRDELLGLVTRMEQAVLDLTARAQLADERVQQQVVAMGRRADTRKDSELAVLYRQRIAVFQAILAGLKRAVAAR
ncbi:hypothetical protein G3N55_09525 [Dissulfurirhabdus thermomarina]|uniref:Uncharacterized protein n=1 Tax=Dissulfurirhabdus thermomarina TaxID=1765737 RepID=A0A6N9TRM7_DISTH|nr:hypothetical protein [Dissulfurirhabdus thermomarina]NDY43080.1 hypothetical protein [Dissulfurirhabdus thermomarina]NMX24362.1 hypothetical protein [Dissulfurirhabdus thermomarina]